jgi:cell wall-associated NlpC family hydrolase
MTSLHPVDTTTLMRVIGEFLGTPYDYGGETNEGIDCSAFTQSVFEKAFTITLPRSTEEQYRIGRKIGKGNLASGDLVFFNTTGYVPSHVGIYVGSGQFAHASVTEGVTITSLSAPYYSRRYVGARRVRP